MQSRLLGVVSLAAMLPASLAMAQGYSFTVLDSTEPNESESTGILATSISGNGRVVIGTSARRFSSDNRLIERPYAWIRGVNGAWQRVDLPMLGRTNEPPGEAQNAGRPLAISFDGSVIGGMVGPRVNPLSFNYGTAAIWTNVLTGPIEVTRVLPLALPNERSYVCGMSSNADRMLVFSQVFEQARTLSVFANGQVQSQVVGNQDGPNSAYFYNGNALSADGSVFAYSDFSTGLPYRWSADQGPTQLPIDPTLIPIERHGVAWATSPDGATVGGWVGEVETFPSFQYQYPAIWNHQSLVRLPHTYRRTPSVPGSILVRNALVTDISADARVIVGALNPNQPYTGSFSAPTSWDRAAVWINRQLRPLDQMLLAEGVDLQGVTPGWLVAVSDDGSTITGWGTRLRAGTTTYEGVTFVATILPPGTCDDIDFNRDGNRFDPLDIEAFLSVFSEGPCLPAGASCRDIDFNNDGSLFDPEDVDAFLRVFSEGPCTL